MPRERPSQSWASLGSAFAYLRAQIDSERHNQPTARARRIEEAMNGAVGALCEVVAAEAAHRNVCVYHDNRGRDIVVSNNVYPTLADVDHTGSDAAKWDAIDAAWRKVETVAGVLGIQVEKVDSEGGAPPCSRIRIEAAAADEAVKLACRNGYPGGP